MSVPTLSDALDHSLKGIFEILPLERAMQRLVVDRADPALEPAVREVERALEEPPLAERADLAAGLWLYVDQLERSHRLSQSLDTPTGAFWHAIMHRREGDFSNAKYWYRRAGHHPAMSRITVAGGSAGAGTTIGEYEPANFVDRVARAHAKGNGGLYELLSTQRREWLALFEWCAEQ